jgi:hypothetical protein
VILHATGSFTLLRTLYYVHFTTYTLLRTLYYVHFTTYTLLRTLFYINFTTYTSLHKLTTYTLLQMWATWARTGLFTLQHTLYYIHITTCTLLQMWATSARTGLYTFNGRTPSLPSFSAKAISNSTSIARYVIEHVLENTFFFCQGDLELHLDRTVCRLHVYRTLSREHVLGSHGMSPQCMDNTF